MSEGGGLRGSRIWVERRPCLCSPQRRGVSSTTLHLHPHFSTPKRARGENWGGGAPAREKDAPQSILSILYLSTRSASPGVVPALGLHHDDAAGSRNRDKMEDEPPFGDPKAVNNHFTGQQVQSTGEDRRPHGGVQWGRGAGERWGAGELQGRWTLRRKRSFKHCFLLDFLWEPQGSRETLPAGHPGTSIVGSSSTLPAQLPAQHPLPSSLHCSLGTSQSRGQVKAEGPALSRSDDGTSPGSVWSCMSQIHLCPLRSRVLLSGCFWLGVKWQREGHLCRSLGVIVIARLLVDSLQVGDGPEDGQICCLISMHHCTLQSPVDLGPGLWNWPFRQGTAADSVRVEVERERNPQHIVLPGGGRGKAG